MLKLTASLNQAISSYYHLDPSAPSLISSFLATKNVWYFSIVRYSQRFGQGKIVVLNANGPDYVSGLKSLASGWIKSIGGVPQGNHEITRLEKIISEPTP